MIDLDKDLKTRGCPVCDYMHRAVLDFFSQWVNAFANHGDVQDEYAASLGFCPVHTWQLESLISPRGISAGYPTLLKRFARELSELAGASGNLAKDVEKLARRDHCAICILTEEAEKIYVSELADFLRRNESRESYGQSQGVCLYHLSLLLASIPVSSEDPWP